MRNYTTIEFCLVNLGNTGQFKYFEAEELADVNIAYNTMESMFKADEIEIQALSHSQFVTDNIYPIFELLEETDADLYEIIHTLEATGCMEQTKEVIKDYRYQFIRSDEKIDAFIFYIEELGYLNNVPDNLINYIDYEKLMQDFEIEGLTIHRVSDEQFIFVY